MLSKTDVANYEKVMALLKQDIFRGSLQVRLQDRHSFDCLVGRAKTQGYLVKDLGSGLIEIGKSPEIVNSAKLQELRKLAVEAHKNYEAIRDIEAKLEPMSAYYVRSKINEATWGLFPMMFKPALAQLSAIPALYSMCNEDLARNEWLGAFYSYTDLARTYDTAKELVQGAFSNNWLFRGKVSRDIADKNSSNAHGLKKLLSME